MASLPGSLVGETRFASEIGTFQMGIETPVDGMPVAGTACHVGVAAANRLIGLRHLDHGGDVTLDANFLASTMNGTIDLIGFPLISMDNLTNDGDTFSAAWSRRPASAPRHKAAPRVGSPPGSVAASS